jgi:murein DD-endopeptidase MepM/ murein hydrolase activator NlpD
MEKVGVKEGDKVKRGDTLGTGDNTGNSSGPHLHFGVRIHPNKRGDGWGGYADPIPFMNPDDVIIPDNIRSAGPELPPSGMAPDEPGRERP